MTLSMPNNVTLYFMTYMYWVTLALLYYALLTTWHIMALLMIPLFILYNDHFSTYCHPPCGISFYKWYNPFSHDIISLGAPYFTFISLHSGPLPWWYPLLCMIIYFTWCHPFSSSYWYACWYPLSPCSPSY